MLDWTKITEEIHKFVQLPASKQIIFIMLSVILVSFIFNIQGYLNKRKENSLRDKQLTEYKILIEKDIVIKDSLVNVIYTIKLNNFEENLKRSDSLLKESQKLRNSILKMKK